MIFSLRLGFYQRSFAAHYNLIELRATNDKSMRAAVALLTTFLILMGCNPSDEVLKNEILNTDLAFSALSKEKGMAEAFIQYAAEEVIKPSPGKQPIVGKEALIKSFENAKNDFELTWEPLKADVSGNLGYT